MFEYNVWECICMALIEKGALNRRELVKILTDEYGFSKSTAYKAISEFEKMLTELAKNINPEIVITSKFDFHRIMPNILAYLFLKRLKA